MKKAIYSALDKNLKRRTDMERLHLFPDEEIPEEIKMNLSNWIRPLRPIPKPLQTYTEEEIKNFPKVYDFPTDYIVR